MTPIPEAIWLKFTLVSDATFGRGDGVAGAVDAEVQHDELGLPYVSGKTLKGLLGAECAEVLFALQQQAGLDLEPWQASAQRLFGAPGSQAVKTGLMHVSDGRLPADLCQAVAADFAPLSLAQRGEQQRANLEALTGLRRQTAMDAETGAPLRNTLRTMRVILRDTLFESELIFAYDLDAYPLDRALLAACVLAFRRGGTGRNRGRGRLRAELHTGAAVVTDSWFVRFEQEVMK